MSVARAPGQGAGSGFLSALAEQADDWAQRGLVRRRRTVAGPCGPQLSLAGERGARLSFLSNDYLGFAAEPALREAVAEAALRWGSGSGASALISGHMLPHADAEQALAQFVGCEAALLFITGYMANLAILSSLVQGPEDVVFSDALNHASLIDGCRLSRARVCRYPHLDLESLSELLVATPGRRKLIVSDGVFSMDGDVADVVGLLALAERHDALLVVDDAHGFGVLGPQGRGVLAEADLHSPRLVLMGTLGKAVGLSGAFVAGSGLVIEHLLQHGRTYMFSTAPSPALAGAIPLALDLVGGRVGEGRRAQLGLLRSQLQAAAQGAGGRSLPDGRTPIVPLAVGAAADAIAYAEALAEAGVLVAGIRPPTVPEGTSRLRISLSAAHSLADVHGLSLALEKVGL